MVIINTHMSMHVSIEWNAVTISIANIDCGVGGVSRGMLVGTVQGTASGGRRGTDETPGGDHMPTSSSPRRRGADSEAGGAGPSRARGPGFRGSRPLEGESTSESE